MIKVLILVFGLALIVSFNTAYAQNMISIDNATVEELTELLIQLMNERKYENAMIVLDTILEDDPNNLSALSNKAAVLINLKKYEESLNISNQVLEKDPTRLSTLENKAMAFRMLKQYEKAYETYNSIIKLDPGNVNIQKSMGLVLAEMPTVPTTNSPYTIHLQMVVRDSDDNLIAVLESSNARYLPSKYFEEWWELVKEKGMVIEENGYEKFRLKETQIPLNEHVGRFEWERNMGGWKIVMFSIFVPMMSVEKTEIVEVQYTIIKN